MDKNPENENKEVQEETYALEEKEEVISIIEDDREEAEASDKKERAIETKETIRPRKKRRLKLALFIILIILLTGGFSGGSVYLWLKNKNKVAKKEGMTAPPKEETKKVEAPKDEANVVYVNSLVGLNMRKTAILKGELITILKYDTKLTVEKEEGIFYFGKDASGNEGYFAKEFTSKTDPLLDWITYNGKNYTVKYPKDWLKKICEDSGYLGFAPDEESLQSCNSEKVALVSITEIDQYPADFVNEEKAALDTFAQSEITVNGASATKVTGTAKQAEVGPQVGSIESFVVIKIDDKTTVISYIQYPTGTDYTDVFDLMVENFSLRG